MTPNQTVTHYIGAQEVREGVRIPVGSNRDEIRFAISTVCESVSPMRWRGEVTFAGTTIVTTEVVDDQNRAGRLAETALTKRLTDLFSGSAT